MANGNSDKNGALLAFLLGAGAGLAAGVLFAPRQGRETRYILRQKAASARAKINEEVKKEKEMVGDVVDSAKQAVEETKEVVRDAKESAKRRIREHEN